MHEKASQFSATQIAFQTCIADKAQFAFASLPLARITSAIALFIDSAVVNVNEQGNVKIRLDALSDTVTIAIQDNGKGLNFEKLDKMLNRNRNVQPDDQADNQPDEFGMAQIWSLLEECNGVLNVDTLIDDGTSVEMTFPRVAVPDWMATGIDLSVHSLIVVLDPDEAVHTQWVSRLDIYQQLYPGLCVHYFHDARLAFDFIVGLSPDDMARLVLLSEYDLPNPPPDGLQIIEIAKVRCATLVTRQFSNVQLQREAVRLKVKILPMHMIPIVPICFDS